MYASPYPFGLLKEGLFGEGARIVRGEHRLVERTALIVLRARTRIH
jgi:hypothetical protein